MKREELLEAIGGIDEGLLMEAGQAAPKGAKRFGKLLLAAAVIAALVYIMYQLVQFFRRAEKGKRLYRTLVTLISAVCSVYALFCLLWGVYYYGEDFAAEQLRLLNLCYNEQ